MPLQATSGAASYDGFGGGVPFVPTYIEDVFSTYLYTGNGSTQTITNGIDLSTYGGLVWTKCRNDGVLTHRLNDTVRGITNRLFSNLTNAQSASATSITAVSTTGYTVGSENGFNQSSNTFVSWTFREQPKFFDVVTYTGNGSNRTIAHNLGSVPGAIIIKRTDTADNWVVYHRSLGNDYELFLNLTVAKNYTNDFNFTNPTSTGFSVNGNDAVNANGGTYVAYLFAHDAGGFGLTGSDNVITCGSYTGNGSATGPVVTLGYEPQWVLVKNASVSGNNWLVFDTMRGMSFSTSAYLRPNTTDPESIGTGWIIPQATGFQLGTTVSSINGSGSTYIYIAIRRGPMKTPTSGTSVFYPSLNRSGVGSGTVFTAGFTSDVVLPFRPSSNKFWTTRMLGDTGYLESNSTATFGGISLINYTDGPSKTFTNAYGGIGEVIFYALARAPGFMDVVCYTGTGSATTFSHNLGVVPELMIVKIRNQPGAAWAVYNAASGNTKVIRLNTTAAQTTSSAYWNNTTPTASVFTVGNDGDVNNAGDTYVAYLFATVAGVSKVGGYTGTGTTLQVDCGFTAGARFILIKRTDSTGDWYVWDSTRGIVAGNDPYLLMNSTAAEVTNTDYIDTYSAGFEISSTAPAAINANGGSFVFLAIA